MHVQRLIFCLTFQYFLISQGQSGYKWYSLPNMKKKYIKVTERITWYRI